MRLKLLEYEVKVSLALFCLSSKAIKTKEVSSNVALTETSLLATNSYLIIFSLLLKHIYAAFNICNLYHFILIILLGNSRPLNYLLLGDSP